MRNEKVGQLLKELRVKNNLTQAELADKVGVTYQAVSRWEKGINTPNLDTLIALKQLYKISVDELLLEVDRSTILNNDERLHWVFRFFVFPIIFFILSFCVTQFYLFLNTGYAMTMIALFMMLILMLIISFVKVKNRMRFYLIILGLFILSTGIIYGTQFHYFNQMEVPYLMAYDSFLYDVEYSDQMPIHVEFTFNNEENILLYHRLDDKISIYNLNSNIDSMLTTFETFGKPVMSVAIISDIVYYSTYDEYVDACDIYQINLSTQQSELVVSSDINFDVFSDGTELYFLTRYEPIIYKEDSIYILNDNTIELLYDFDFKVLDILYSEFYESFYLSIENSDFMHPNEMGNILIYDDHFNFQHAIFPENQPERFKIKDDGSKIISSHQDELIRILYTDIETTGLVGIVESIHNTNGTFYTYSGALLDPQWNELTSNAFVLSNWRQGSGHFIFQRDSDRKFVNIEQGEVTLLTPVSQQTQEIAIKSYFRHVLMFCSLPLLALTVTYGVTLKKK